MENNEKTNSVEEPQKEVRETEPVTESVPAKNPGLYTAGLICSIVGLCLFWSVWVGIICGVLGIIFGAITYNKTNKKIPIILGGVATGLAIIMIIIYSVVGARLFNRAADKLENNLNEAFDSLENIKDMYEEESEDEDKYFEETKDEEESEKNESSMDAASKKVEEKINETSEKIDNVMDETTKKVEDLFNNISN